MFKKFVTVFTVFVMVLGLCACGAEPAQPTFTDPAPEQSIPTVSGTITVTDMVGRQLEIVPGSYQKVVCIGAGALRMYSYIGDISLLCGVEDIDNTALENRPQIFDGVARPYVMAYEQELQKLPSCGVGGPMAQAAEAEKLLYCQPDLVISEFEDADKSATLQQQLGVPVITLKSGRDGVFDPAFSQSLELLGTVLDRQIRAQELVRFIDDQTRILQDMTADITPEEQPSVYICGLGSWGTTDHLMTAQSYAPFTIANIKNAVADVQLDGIQPIEEEKFVAMGDQIDVMILDAAAVKNIAPLYAQEPEMFDTCKAWNEGQVYLQMAYNAYYTNYELALCNAWFIAKSVYPERFQQIDMTEKTNEITQAFLGKALAQQIFDYPASYGGYQKLDPVAFFQDLA